jgi:hypothetical protein
MIKKLESFGHELEKLSSFNRTIYKCVKCNHYFRENFFNEETIMESSTKEITSIYITANISKFTCDEIIIRDIIE